MDKLTIFKDYQKTGFFHPYTCSNDVCRLKEDFGELYLKEDCETMSCNSCGYTQPLPSDFDFKLVSDIINQEFKFKPLLKQLYENGTVLTKEEENAYIKGANEV